MPTKFHLLPIGWALQELEDREKHQAEQAAQHAAENAIEAAARESDMVFLINFMGYSREEAEKIAAEIVKLPFNIKTFLRAAEGPLDFETFWAKATYDYTANREDDING